MVILRYLSADGRTIETFSASVEPKSEGGGETTGDFLFKNLPAVTWSPDGIKIAWLSADNAGAQVITSDPDGGNQREIFRSGFSEWLLDWPLSGEIVLNTKPSAGVDGFTYSLNPQTGRMERLIGNIKGLTTSVSKNGEKILYLRSGSSGPELNVFDRETAESRELAGTLPEKCVWSAKDENIAYCGIPLGLGRGEYPDDWHKGLVATADAVWKVDTENNFAELVGTLEDGGGMDIFRPFMDPAEGHLFFINKKDQSFWSLKLK